MCALMQPQDVVDKPDAETLDPKQLNDASVEFDNVSFKYDSQAEGRYALSNVSFKVPTGGSLAIVGKTGAGKSSITRLLFRLYELPEDSESGVVRVGGWDVRNVTQSSLREAIGIIPQDCVLFNDTLLYNVQFGSAARAESREQLATREEVWKACEAAQLADFIKRQPKGLDTVVGERGLRLSGGEKQRVAIARCLLKNPSILIADEATSSVDSKTEKSIKSALDTSAQGRTTITIAHRLSTILNADTVIVLDEGRVVEQGSPSELLSQPSKFKEMYDEQQTAGTSSEA